LAHGIELLGEFEENPTVVRDAITQYTMLQDEARKGGFAAAYAAELEKAIGDCWSFLKEYDDAVMHYEASLKQKAADLTRVFLARAQANLGDLIASRRTLLSVDSSQLDVYAHYDFAMAWTNLAMRSLDKEDITTAKLHLKIAQAFWPIYVSERDSALIGLLELSPRKAKVGLRRLIGMLNRYVSLNPNVFGIGLNLNRIVEDVGAEKQKEASNV
jgi:hypothetical protein